jgi:VWFA-related protein
VGRYIKTIIAICTLFLISSQPIISQKEKVHQYKVEVKEKLLYVLALDKDGNPVNDLKKEDFQLFVDGKLQEIGTFSLISHTAKETEEKKKVLLNQKFKAPNNFIQEKDTSRRFILAVLPFRYKSECQKRRIEEALKYLIEKSIYPNDWISIIVMHTDWIISIQDFTNDKEKLLRKIENHFKYESAESSTPLNRLPTTDEEINQVSQLPIFQGATQIKGGIDSIPGLELIAEKMGILKGRKIIITFDFPIQILSSSFIDRTFNFFKMIEKMLFNNITIYCSEMEGTHVPNTFDPHSSIRLSQYLLSSGHLICNPNDDVWEPFQNESSLFALSHETGGKYYYNSDSTKYFIDDIGKMNSSFYLIGFPMQEEFPSEISHTIKLDCNRDNIKLCYGNKYYAPHEIAEKKFKEIYKTIQLSKYLFLDIKRPPLLEISGQWIPLTGSEDQTQLGALDFYLPSALFQKLPVSYLFGCSCSDAHKQRIIMQEQVDFSSSNKKYLKTSQEYTFRILTKLPKGKNSLRLVTMDCGSGEYGRLEINISEDSRASAFSNIILGELAERKLCHELKDYSEALYNLKKELYNLLSIKDSIIIPSVSNCFKSGENVTFCLLHKIPKNQAKKYKNQKPQAYLYPDREGETHKSKLPVHIKKIGKDYYQYYGTIDTSNLALGKYKIEINVVDSQNSIIRAIDTIFEIIK